jgi:hypothetical protein
MGAALGIHPDRGDRDLPVFDRDRFRRGARDRDFGNRVFGLEAFGRGVEAEIDLFQVAVFVSDFGRDFGIHELGLAVVGDDGTAVVAEVALQRAVAEHPGWILIESRQFIREARAQEVAHHCRRFEVFEGEGGFFAFCDRGR